MRLKIVKGDITRLNVDVIVNAANNRLVGGGGVDGAIHRAAGPQLKRACEALNGCATGDVKETLGFGLRAKAIFHTVGPVWQGGMAGEPQLLASCYSKCLNLAQEKRYSSIAFPAISCGVYGYPAHKAVEIALYTVTRFFAQNSASMTVLFCCFDSDMENMYFKKLP